MRVLCKLPNAAETISGVAFSPRPEGMLSEPIDDETAAHFLRIPGYEAVDDQEMAPAQEGLARAKRAR